MKFKHHNRWMEEDDLSTPFEKRYKLKDRCPSSDELRDQYREHKEHGFTCIQCGFPATADRELSGVNNRNHCPRCLWSRHVDELKAGDRKSECRSRMQPIGLTRKQTNKRYGQEQQGELMLIHHCTGCGKISINRIAADDDAMRIYQIFEQSAELTLKLKEQFESEGIHPLGKGDLTTVYSQLFGWQAILEEFESHQLNQSETVSIPDEAESNLIDLKLTP